VSIATAQIDDRVARGVCCAGARDLGASGTVMSPERNFCVSEKRRNARRAPLRRRISADAPDLYRSRRRNLVAPSGCAVRVRLARERGAKNANR
jgi:hypothetical protein